MIRNKSDDKTLTFLVKVSVDGRLKHERLGDDSRGLGCCSHFAFVLGG